ncbi:MAG: hypothetical protein E6G94_01350 [Alphaproteobacteria bacterium]|nr:MAG: hypothetical protein E6G94_01350 [Alphaproteobacteria bacterium]
MRPSLIALLPAALLAGCAGYAIDYAKPKTSIIQPALARYALDARQSQCVSDTLTKTLTVWQLRQLQIVAGALKPAAGDNRPLGGSDLVWAAKNVRDPEVRPKVEQAVASCGIAGAPARVAAPTVGEQPAVAAEQPALKPGAPAPDYGKPLATIPPPAPGAPVAAPVPGGPAPVAAEPGLPNWINLGAAPTGQSIAVDAATMEGKGTLRTAWFRLSNPGKGRSPAAYYLRIDCAAKTINSLGLKRFGANDEVVDNVDYGPNGEGAAPIEGGTVMEIAYLALCT